MIKEKSRKKQMIEVLHQIANGRISVREAYASFIAYSCSRLNIAYQYKLDEERNRYLDSIMKPQSVEIKELSSLFDLLVEELENNPDQDFLGEIYEEMKLTDAKKGQFLTPYSISKMMATMNGIGEDIQQTIVRIADPCTGTGGMLVAAANIIKEKKFSAQKYMLYAQDIDPLMALTSYVQLSLQGMQGIVKVGNSLDATDIAFDLKDMGDTWVLPITYIYQPSLLKEAIEKSHNKKVRNLEDRSF